MQFYLFHKQREMQDLTNIKAGRYIPQQESQKVSATFGLVQCGFKLESSLTVFIVATPSSSQLYLTGVWSLFCKVVQEKSRLVIILICFCHPETWEVNAVTLHDAASPPSAFTLWPTAPMRLFQRQLRLTKTCLLMKSVSEWHTHTTFALAYRSRSRTIECRLSALPADITSLKGSPCVTLARALFELSSAKHTAGEGRTGEKKPEVLKRKVYPDHEIGQRSFAVGSEMRKYWGTEEFEISLSAVALTMRNCPKTETSRPRQETAHFVAWFMIHLLVPGGQSAYRQLRPCENESKCWRQDKYDNLLQTGKLCGLRLSFHTLTAFFFYIYVNLHHSTFFPQTGLVLLIVCNAFHLKWTTPVSLQLHLVVSRPGNFKQFIWGTNCECSLYLHLRIPAEEWEELAVVRVTWGVSAQTGTNTIQLQSNSRKWNKWL